MLLAEEADWFDIDEDVVTDVDVRYKLESESIKTIDTFEQANSEEHVVSYEILYLYHYYRLYSN